MLSVLAEGYHIGGQTSKVNDYTRTPEFFKAYCYKMILSDARFTWLAAIGSAGPNLYIQREITKNHFKIARETKGMKVSWQVSSLVTTNPYIVYVTLNWDL